MQEEPGESTGHERTEAGVSTGAFAPVASASDLPAETCPARTPLHKQSQYDTKVTSSQAQYQQQSENTTSAKTMVRNEKAARPIKRKNEAESEAVERPAKKPKKECTLDAFLRRGSSDALNMRGEVSTAPNHEKSGSEESVEEGRDEKETQTKKAKSHGRGQEERVAGPTGLGRSTRFLNKAREARRAGTFVLNLKRYAQFQRKIRAIDPAAEFDGDEWAVQHSKCRGWYIMRSPYGPEYFVKHIKSCKVTNNLDNYGQRAAPSSCKVFITRSCSGLTKLNDIRIETYLLRPIALGGGGRAITTIAQEKYGITFSDLNDKQKEDVRRAQSQTWTWDVNTQFRSIYSKSCLKTIKLPDDRADREDQSLACSRCLALLEDKKFDNAISKDEPELENMKFANKPFQHTEEGEKFAKVHLVQTS